MPGEARRGGIAAIGEELPAGHGAVKKMPRRTDDRRDRR
jgi:hypothetical protein